jgi:hypothetical protein
MLLVVIVIGGITATVADALLERVICCDYGGTVFELEVKAVD